jgi:cytochrome b561/polyisoprenoid-binding protein YceI
MKAETSRYTIVAITLHWVMAALLLFMIWLGWNMDDNEARFQLHKSIGILILFLTLVRVIWRAMNPPPPLPDDMPAYEKLASHLVHMAFYGLMVILPLAGWLLVSTSKFKVPTVLFETVSWPHLPAPGFLRTDIGHVILENIHSKGAWVLIVLLGLHVAGAVKHEFAAEDGVLKKMLPGLFGKPTAPTSARGYVRAFGTAIIAFALIALIPIAGSTQPGNATPQADAVAAPVGDVINANWNVNYDASEIRFTGIYDGAEFTGTFDDWSADVEFHADDLESSQVLVTVRTATADAGKKLYNDSLKSAEWFDTNTFPEARIRLTNFRETEEHYTADAAIMLKSGLVTVPLDFTLEIDGGTATLNGTAVMNRKAFDLGQDSDPAGTWVGDDITVTVSGSATRK